MCGYGMHGWGAAAFQGFGHAHGCCDFGGSAQASIGAREPFTFGRAPFTFGRERIAFGPFGMGFGPHPRGRGRRRRGDVRLALLMLLKLEGPRNGYQLMQALAQRSDGRWQPSPGSVYPALSQLEDEGLIESVQHEGESGHSFALTAAGEAHLAQRGEVRAPWEPPDGVSADSPRTLLRDAIIAAGRAAWHVAQDGTEAQIEEAARILEDARRALYRLLSEAE